MAFYHRAMDKKRSDYRRHEGDVIGSLCRLGGRPASPKTLLEQEKRIRREIANSNERRRMQSINDGFQSLRSLLPHREGEKLSKAAVLHNAADYVLGLEEKVRTLQDLTHLSRCRPSSPSHLDSDGSSPDSPLLKRRKRDTVDSVDEGIGSSSPARSDNEVDDVKRENMDLRLQLNQERALRKVLEEQIRNGDCPRCSSDCVSDSSDHIQLQYAKGSKALSKTSPRNFCSESGIGSPVSQISSQDIESPRIMSPRASSPDLSGPEVHDNVPTRLDTVLVPCSTELLPIDTSPGTTPNHYIYSTSEDSMRYNPLDYKSSTSRQNLDTIVEAIRLVEGDHMFRDIVDSSKDHILQSSTERQCLLQPVITKQSFAPSRPGVIVPNPS